MKAVELGGGANPSFHPNVDCRQLPNVDLVADFEKPLPFLPSNEFDLVYSAFALEHISWRNIPQFVNEIYRILKQNGRAVIITADLRAQCLFILRKTVWTFAEVETIFGSQDFAENTHKSSMSQELAFSVFTKAGFKNINIQQVGICSTDMQIEGQK